MKNKNITLAFFLISIIHSGVQADEYHYNNILVGDRASAMGGAYTAISDDPSGLYYNPAGIVYGSKKGNSASSFLYRTKDTTYKNVIAGRDWKRSSKGFIPGFAGVTQPMLGGMGGISFAITDSDNEAQSQTFTNLEATAGTFDRLTVNVNNELTEFRIGPSYAYDISPTLSVGMTLYFYSYENRVIFNQNLAVTSNPVSGEYYWSNIYRTQDDFGFEPVIGLMWTPADKHSIGVSLRQVTLNDSVIDIQVTEQTQAGVGSCSDAATDGCFSFATGSFIDQADDHPFILTTGWAYFPNSRLILSADLTSYFDDNNTWNLALGSEYYFKPSWNVRAGLFTNNANTPKLVVGEYNQVEHIDEYGLSLSVGRFTRTSSLSFGLTQTYGQGKAQVLGGTNFIQDAHRKSSVFSISSSYSY